MLKVGDKIICINDNMGIPANTILEVITIKDNVITVVGETTINNMFIAGIMSYNEYKENCELYVAPVKSQWSEWLDLNADNVIRNNSSMYLGCLIKDFMDCFFKTYKAHNDIEYRTNGNTVETRLRYQNKVYKSSARCCKEDKFDLNTGINICLLRLFVKLMDAQKDEIINNI